MTATTSPCERPDEPPSEANEEGSSDPSCQCAGTTPIERVQEAAVSAWVKTLAAANAADAAANCFSALQSDGQPMNLALAAHGARMQLLRVLFDVAEALAACGRVEALARTVENDWEQ